MAVDANAAAATLAEYAGLDPAEAKKLVDAVVAAAEREALELLAGDAPVPSSLADARALRLRYITETAGRALKPREVEVILRLPSTGAVAALRRLNATYPRTVDGSSGRSSPRPAPSRKPAARTAATGIKSTLTNPPAWNTHISSCSGADLPMTYA